MDQLGEHPIRVRRLDLQHHRPHPYQRTEPAELNGGDHSVRPGGTVRLQEVGGWVWNLVRWTKLYQRYEAEAARRGVEIDPKRQDYDYGRFAWIMDPAGNRIDLWEPPKT